MYGRCSAYGMGASIYLSNGCSRRLSVALQIGKMLFGPGMIVFLENMPNTHNSDNIRIVMQLILMVWIA